jgi:uncharacterized protein (DUF362 family)
VAARCGSTSNDNETDRRSRMARIGLARGDRSYEAVRKALEQIVGDVQIPMDRPVLIKPNMVATSVELAATPVGAVRATMDVLIELGVQHFIIGEGTTEGEGNTWEGFERYGYLPLRDHYDVEFRNLHEDEQHILFEALDKDLGPAQIRLAKTCFDAYVVSVGRMKTHCWVIVTLAIKNLAIGSIYHPDRQSQAVDVGPGDLSHQPHPLNLTLARLYQANPPDLAVLDGVAGMEGNGPTGGTPVASGIAVAGTDALAVDLVASGLMGFDYRTVGYLWYLSELAGLSLDEIDVVGEDPVKCVTRYRPHDRFPELLDWWV